MIRKLNVKNFQFEDLMQHPNLFADNFRMSPETFESLFSMLEPLLLPKKNTRRDAISPKQKLAIVLEYVLNIFPISYFDDLKFHLIAGTLLLETFKGIFHVAIALASSIYAR